MDVSRFEFLDNGDILVVDRNGGTMLHKHDGNFRNWDYLGISFSVRVKQLYDAYLELANRSRPYSYDNDKTEFLIYDYDDDNVIGHDIKENNIENTIRMYAKGCDLSENSSFTVGLFEHKNDYRVSPISSIEILKI